MVAVGSHLEAKARSAKCNCKKQFNSSLILIDVAGLLYLYFVMLSAFFKFDVTRLVWIDVALLDK